MFASNSPGCQPLEPPVRATWNTITASSAPNGSISTPSHFKTARTSRVGRINASNGKTTVGPDTTRIAAIRNGTSVPSPLNSSATAPVTLSHVISAPSVTSHTTTRRILGVISPKDILSPASNRITPTATETNGWYSGPSKSLGRTSLVRMPATNPTGSRTTIAGSRNSRANSCEPTASTTTRPIPSSNSFVDSAVATPQDSHSHSPASTGAGAADPRQCTPSSAANDQPCATP